MVPAEDEMGSKEQHRYPGEQMKSNPPASEEISANFGAHKDGDLAGKEPPRLFFESALGASYRLLEAHVGLPSDPMRY